MYWPEHFTALIQVISAINFAYIVTQFSEKVYDYIFDEFKMYNRRFNRFTEELEMTHESMQQMEPLETTNGNSTKGRLDALKSNCKSLKSIWEEQKKATKDETERLKKTKGQKSLFLYASIYCIFDLFNIAVIATHPHDSFLIYSYSFNVISLLAMAYLSWVIFKDKWCKQDDKACTSKVTTCFFIVLAGTVIFGLINWVATLFVCFPFIAWFVNLANILCVLLPAYPILHSIVFAIYSVFKVKMFAASKTKVLISELEKLNREKQDLDTAYRVLAENINWGGVSL